jgi:putrescine aminotransferase
MPVEEQVLEEDFFDMSPEAEAQIAQVVAQYRDHVNPGLAKLMQFGGFGDVEVEAQGCYVRTASGAEYLDFLGAYGVFSVGHRHPRVIAAVKRQLDTMPLSTRTFFNATTAQLAERLGQLAPGNLNYVFFSNSGAEAVEAALKFARRATGKTDFISTEGGYHGKTLGALSVTGREKYRHPFEPMLPGVTFVPYDDAQAVANALTERTAAVIVEPIQGEGGIIVPSPGYLKALRAICDQSGVLLIADEVQTGMGRTGTLFACEEEAVTPDILTLAKALGGGVMPIGATLATLNIWEKVFGENPLLHTSTFGGNPLACAAGLATLQVIEQEDLCRNARERGAQMLAGLQEVQRELPDALTEVRGRGLMIGVEFAVKDVAELTINGMARRGVIAAYTLNNPNVIRLEPPLLVTEAQVETAVTALAESVAESMEFLSDL